MKRHSETLQPSIENMVNTRWEMRRNEHNRLIPRMPRMPIEPVTRRQGNGSNPQQAFRALPMPNSSRTHQTGTTNARTRRQQKRRTKAEKKRIADEEWQNTLRRDKLHCDDQEEDDKKYYGYLSFLDCIPD
jgi:hypothetical protein